MNWTDAKRQRRYDLILQKYSVGLDESEALELAVLQEEMREYRHQVPPLPLGDAQRLLEKLCQEEP